MCSGFLYFVCGLISLSSWLIFCFLICGLVKLLFLSFVVNFSIAILLLLPLNWISYQVQILQVAVSVVPLLTPRCRVLPEQLTGLQLLKKFPHFMEPEGSLPHSQTSATCLYRGPAQSSPHTHIPPPGDSS